MTQFLHTGGGQPPEWYINLELAEVWGCKPWEVDDAPMVWVVRHSRLMEIREDLRRVKEEGLGG